MRKDLKRSLTVGLAVLALVALAAAGAQACLVDHEPGGGRHGRWGEKPRPPAWGKNGADAPFFVIAPIAWPGPAWKELFKDWDPSRLLEQIKQNPVWVFFGGFRGPLFLGIFLPDGLEGVGCPRPDPQNAAVPIPGAALLLGTGLAGLGLLRLRRGREVSRKG